MAARCRPSTSSGETPLPRHQPTISGKLHIIGNITSDVAFFGHRGDGPEAARAQAGMEPSSSALRPLLDATAPRGMSAARSSAAISAPFARRAPMAFTAVGSPMHQSASAAPTAPATTGDACCGLSGPRQARTVADANAKSRAQLIAAAMTTPMPPPRNATWSADAADSAAAKSSTTASHRCGGNRRSAPVNKPIDSSHTASTAKACRGPDVSVCATVPRPIQPVSKMVQASARAVCRRAVAPSTHAKVEAGAIIVRCMACAGANPARCQSVVASAAGQRRPCPVRSTKRAMSSGVSMSTR